MGTGKSLLAKTLIENIDHKCNLPGCDKVVPHKEYKQHQDECNYRLVKCPGLDI